MVGVRFGTNGVRGIANEEITPEVALAIGRAFGSLMGGRIAVGRDTRLSGTMLKSAAIAGLLSSGCEVDDLDMAPTPAVQYYVRDNADAGLVVTASHNPREYNGIKLIDSDGIELPSYKERQVEAMLDSGEMPRALWSKTSSLTHTDCNGPYIRGIESIASRLDDLKVVVDPGCGAGSLVTPILLRRLGCQVITVNAQPDGSFPGRQPEPSPENLRALSDIVKDAGAHAGVAHDGDADRAVFIDERGEFVDEDILLALMADHVLKEKKGPVVTPVSSSQRIADVAERHGVELIWTPVGSIHVARRMIETGAVFGGEGNGGLIFPEHQYCRDGAMTAVKVLEMISAGESLSELIEAVPRYYNYKAKISCRDPQRIMSHIKTFYEGYEVDLTDGVKAWMEEGWVLIRPSGTEPIIRIFAEARSPKQANNIAEEAIKSVKEVLC